MVKYAPACKCTPHWPSCCPNYKQTFLTCIKIKTRSNFCPFKALNVYSNIYCKLKDISSRVSKINFWVLLLKNFWVVITFELLRIYINYPSLIFCQAPCWDSGFMSTNQHKIECLYYILHKNYLGWIYNLLCISSPNTYLILWGLWYNSYESYLQISFIYIYIYRIQISFL